MITATIQTRKKVKGALSIEKKIECFKAVDAAKERLAPIARDMAICKEKNVDPKVSIIAVSYDRKSEKEMLLEIHAITSIENESGD